MNDGIEEVTAVRDTYEALREAHCRLELLQHGLSEAVAYKQRYPRDEVLCDYLIANIAKEIRMLSLWLREAYGKQEAADDPGHSRMSTDVDMTPEEMFNRQRAVCMGTTPFNDSQDASKGNMIINNFEAQLQETFDQDEAMAGEKATDEKLKAADQKDQLFSRFVHQTVSVCERLFNSEESNGKYLDLNKQY